MSGVCRNLAEETTSVDYSMELENFTCAGTTKVYKVCFWMRGTMGTGGIQGVFRGYSRGIQGAFRGYLGGIQGVFRAY